MRAADFAWACGLVAGGLPVGAWAEGLSPRETAAVLPPGATEVAVFGPLRRGLSPRVEVSTHPLVAAFLAPNIAARVAVLHPPDHDVSLSLEPTLSVPTMALTSPPPLGAEGYLTPTCAVDAAEPARAPDDCQRSGEVLAAGLGLTATLEAWAAWTARIDYTHGVLLTGERAAPLDAWAPVDLLLAPVYSTYRAHVGLRGDRAVTDWLRVALEAHLWRVGEGPIPGRDPHTFGAHLGTDWATSARTRLTAGVFYWNSDQRRTRLVKDSEGFSRYERVRSHDVLPTLDFIIRFAD
ncbi:hypothetical protein L6V77_10015 [Myxococcota bacterium]|nr:hypothetical protein [Myxococcota bacterium]